MAESYQDIMARLNGPQQQEKPKAANDFATYVRTLLENPNPQGSMFSDANSYYADPFRKQNAINQAILDEELRKKKEAEDAAKAAEAAKAAGINTMANYSSGGDGFDYGGDGAGLNSSAPMGSLAAQNAALLGLALTDTAQYFSPMAAAANYGFGLLADSQINAINNSFNALSSTPSGMFSVSDANGNIGTVSNNASIAAQNAAEFGLTPAEAMGYVTGSNLGGGGGFSNGHDAGITGGNSFGGNNPDGGGYNE